jgi:hypothetical protein
MNYLLHGALLKPSEPRAAHKPGRYIFKENIILST